MSSMSVMSPAFNDFLYATICEQPNDMPLSVISAMARLDLDPWTEAAALAGMSADGAALRLSGLLARVVDDRPTQPDRATIAARLVALLPKPPTMSVSGRGAAADVQNNPRFAIPTILCLALLVSMATSVVMANLDLGHGALGRGSGPRASTSGATSAPSRLVPFSPH